jgi:hypothetical protein
LRVPHWMSETIDCLISVTASTTKRLHKIEGSDMHCLPYYYLLGFPKSGTTDLWHRISQHPLQASTTKELHWWSRVRYGKQHYITWS